MLVYLKINTVIMGFFILLTPQSSLQGAAYYIRRNKLAQKQRTGLEVEWGRRSGSNISHPNIVPCFLFFQASSP